VGRQARLDRKAPTTHVNTLAEKTKGLATEFPIFIDRLEIGSDGEEGHFLQKRCAINPFPSSVVDLQVVARMFEDVGFRDFFLKLRSGSVVLLGLEKALHIINLTSQGVVRDFIEVVPQNEQHSESKQELGGGKDCEIGQRKPPADGESSYHFINRSSIKIPLEEHSQPRAQCESGSDSHWCRSCYAAAEQKHQAY